MKIISGGQTGADRAGLDAAKKVGFQTGGWMPKGFFAQDGEHPIFRHVYNMEETAERQYPPRTKLNVINSDVTIRSATDWYSSGERLTAAIIKKFNKPKIDIGPDMPLKPEDVADILLRLNAETINVAGNSERTAPGIYLFTYEFLLQVFLLLKNS